MSTNRAAKSYGQKSYGQKSYGQKSYGQQPYGQQMDDGQSVPAALVTLATLEAIQAERDDSEDWIGGDDELPSTTVRH